MKPAATIALVLIAALVALAAVSAYSAELSGAEAAQCQAEGGCAILTAAKLQALIEQALQQGFDRGARACLKSTT